MSVEHSVEWEFVREREEQGEHLSKFHLVHKNPKWPDLGSNPDRRGGRPVEKNQTFCANKLCEDLRISWACVRHNIPAYTYHVYVLVPVLRLGIWCIIKICALLRTNVRWESRLLRNCKCDYDDIFVANRHTANHWEGQLFKHTHKKGIQFLHETKTNQVFREFHSLNGHIQSRHATETT
jgi:hypothetical protein